MGAFNLIMHYLTKSGVMQRKCQNYFMNYFETVEQKILYKSFAIKFRIYLEISIILYVNLHLVYLALFHEEYSYFTRFVHCDTFFVVFGRNDNTAIFALNGIFILMTIYKDYLKINLPLLQLVKAILLRKDGIYISARYRDEEASQVMQRFAWIFYLILQFFLSMFSK